MITCNGVKLPNPSSMDQGVEAIDAPKSGRDETGTMRARKVSEKTHLDLTFDGLSAEQVKLILDTIRPHLGHEVSFFDANHADYRTLRMYSTPAKVSWLTLSPNKKLSKRVSFSFVEE